MNTRNTTPADVPVRDFNHHADPDLRIDPFATFDRFRDERVFWTPELDGFWVLTRYDDIRAVLRDTERFSNESTAIPPIDWNGQRLIPVELDPPDHGKYRTLLTRYLNGPANAVLATAVEKECLRLVERLAPAGECELVGDFARKLQNALLGAMFDEPGEEDDVPDFGRLSDDLVQASEPARRSRAIRDIMAYLRRAIAGHQTRRTDSTSLIASLSGAEIDGRPLSESETLNMAFLMTMAAIDTLTSSMSFGFRYLAEHPAHQRRLAEDPGAAAAAADELLRLHSVVSIARIVARDTEFAGVRMRAGERVMLSLSLAGRDPHQYPEATTADFDRPNRASHLAFGFGAHRCAGARIATGGMIAALREWHAAIPEYSVRLGTELVTGGGAAASLESLPLVWKT
ncbi:cytochrome P450 [Herbihabitans rhizosphaerae]|uniref:Cytochrome P450 n=1 Tax=Herbihabitans rhizosphaerae TaxID=1872711 RepID=A0A4Q7KFG7_9PSEU|nr:cytochrome P450 [Herbihabitans rhizosphaerae]RZS33952.1 cytochrome P450 [Herbihabitans rhizosphaerae]